MSTLLGRRRIQDIVSFTYKQYNRLIGVNLSLQILFFLLCFNCTYQHVCAGVKAHECRCPGKPERASGSLDLELKAVVSHTAQVLGNDLGSSGREEALVIAEPSFKPSKDKLKLGWLYLPTEELLVARRSHLTEIETGPDRASHTGIWNLAIG